MSEHTVKAVFTFKDQESKERFIEFCNGEKGLSVTRSWEGCQSIECYEQSDNALAVVIWQKWASKANHESYVKHRHDDGSFDFLGELISAPPQISPLRPVVFKSDKEQIEDVVKAMCNKDHRVGMAHTHNDCLFIRPTGNPLNMEGWEKMMTNDDVNVESNDLVSINKMEVCGDMAYVCYTNHGKFIYKGTQNDDIAVLTSVLKKVDGRWVVVHGQRSTGRSPTDAPPVF
jgi:ketosteroid isomerase-like protein